MQLSTLLTILAVGTSSVSAGPRHHVPRQANINNDIITGLLKLNMQDPDPRGFPADFGLSTGITPCQGDRTINSGGKTVNIPCDCPPAPTNATFRAAVKIGLNQGFFPEAAQKLDMNIQQWNNLPFTDPAAIKLRNNAMIVAFQSLRGTKGSGCPGVSAPVLGGTG